jgi:hypothetical protein
MSKNEGGEKGISNPVVVIFWDVPALLPVFQFL